MATLPSAQDTLTAPSAGTSSHPNDRLALERFLVDAMPGLTRWAHRHLSGSVRNHLEPCDVAQEAAMRTIAYLPRFTAIRDDSMPAFLRHVATNLLRDEARRIARRGEWMALDDDQPSKAAGPLEIAIQRERTARHERALAKLCVRDQQLIAARLQGHSYAECARALGWSSADAARMALTRALRTLRGDVEQPAHREAPLQSRARRLVQRPGTRSGPDAH